MHHIIEGRFWQVKVWSLRGKKLRKSCEKADKSPFVSVSVDKSSENGTNRGQIVRNRGKLGHLAEKSDKSSLYPVSDLSEFAANGRDRRWIQLIQLCTSSAHLSSSG